MKTIFLLLFVVAFNQLYKRWCQWCDDDDGKLVDQPNQSTIILIIHHHGNFELNWEIPKPALKIFIHDGGWMIQPSNHSNQTNERPWSKRPRSFVFVRSSIIIKKKEWCSKKKEKKIIFILTRGKKNTQTTEQRHTMIKISRS